MDKIIGDEYITADKKKEPRYVLASFLFLLNILATIFAGVLWAGRNPFEMTEWHYGMTYSLLLMLFLTAHELGHFFAAKYHKIETSLPYFLPFPLPLLSPFGTFGAFIKVRQSIPSRKILFDIGVAGPIAGFIVCIFILIIGFLTLPASEYLYTIHPDYALNGGHISTEGMFFGDTLLFTILKKLFLAPNTFFPPMNEIYHYPFLCVGWFGLFVTSLNMLPIGQLDGGHVIYSMFGKHQKRIGTVLWWILLVIGIGGALHLLKMSIANPSPDPVYTFLQVRVLSILNTIDTYAPWFLQCWNGWLLWVFIGRFIMKIQHPPVQDTSPIGTKRMIVGYCALLIFALSFSYNGIYFVSKDIAGVLGF